jgi:hypothetical protein
MLFCQIGENRLVVGGVKHHLPSTYDRVFEAAPRFGKTGKAGKARWKTGAPPPGRRRLVGGDGFEPPTLSV